MIHMTYTGSMAGTTLCDVPRESNGQYVHASYAPLSNAQYRSDVCPCCMKVWADNAYDSDDAMPDYIKELRQR